MGAISSTNTPPHVKTASKAWNLVVAGYSIAAVGLVAFLTINGASGIPGAATILTEVLVIAGLLLPAAGMLQLRRALGPIKSAARYGFALLALGLIGLLLGIVLVVATSSLSGCIVSVVFITAAGGSAITGAVLLRRHYINIIALNTRGVAYLILGTALIFLGAGVIVGSNIAYEYLISQVQNTVNVDMGATVSSCGCVLTAFSYFVLHDHTTVNTLQ
jgi:hypothetical protein